MVISPRSTIAMTSGTHLLAIAFKRPSVPVPSPVMRLISSRTRPSRPPAAFLRSSACLRAMYCRSRSPSVSSRAVALEVISAIRSSSAPWLAWMTQGSTSNPVTPSAASSRQAVQRRCPASSMYLPPWAGRTSSGLRRPRSAMSAFSIETSPIS